MPSHRDTARKGLKALSVLMERKAGMSAAPAQIAPKLISDSYHHHHQTLVRSGATLFLVDIK